MSKKILITGSNSGIGKLTAELFAENNWQVIATMRNLNKAGDLNGKKNIHIYSLDITNLDSINSAKKNIINDFGKIDVVVNNAGFGVYGAFEMAKEEEIDRQFSVNVKGLMMVTKAWIPHFRENKEGLFINISSIAGLASYPLGSLYISSKWAVEGFTETLFYELRPFGIRLKLVEPGGFRTNFQTTSITWTNDPSIKGYEEKIKNVRKYRNDRQNSLPDPIHVAQKIYEAANDPSDRLRYLIGKDAEKMLTLREKEGAEKYILHQYQNYLG